MRTWQVDTPTLFSDNTMDMDGSQSPTKQKRSRAEMEADSGIPAKESAAQAHDGIVSPRYMRAILSNTIFYR